MRPKKMQQSGLFFPNVTILYTDIYVYMVTIYIYSDLLKALLSYYMQCKTKNIYLVTKITPTHSV